MDGSSAATLRECPSCGLTCCAVGECCYGEGCKPDAATMSHAEALNAINELRSNIIATQSATWSNVTYPLVAILNAAGMEVDLDRSGEQKREHLNAYGGAGGYPGAAKP